MFFKKNMFANIVWGIIGSLVAFALLKWRKQVIDFTGKWGWAERILGMGGSYTAVVLLALIIFLLAITKMSGKLDEIGRATFGRIF